MAPFSTVVAGNSRVPMCSTPKKRVPKSLVFDEVSDNELSKIALPSTQEVEQLNEQNNLLNSAQGQENVKSSDEVLIQIGQKHFIVPTTEESEPIRYHADPNTDQQKLDDSEVIFASIGKPKLSSISEEVEEENDGGDETVTAVESGEEDGNREEDPLNKSVSETPLDKAEESDHDKDEDELKPKGPKKIYLKVNIGTWSRKCVQLLCLP